MPVHAVCRVPVPVSGATPYIREGTGLGEPCRRARRCSRPWTALRGAADSAAFRRPCWLSVEASVPVLPPQRSTARLGSARRGRRHLGSAPEQRSFGIAAGGGTAATSPSVHDVGRESDGAVSVPISGAKPYVSRDTGSVSRASEGVAALFRVCTARNRVLGRPSVAASRLGDPGSARLGSGRRLLGSVPEQSQLRYRRRRWGYGGDITERPRPRPRIRRSRFSTDLRCRTLYQEGYRLCEPDQRARRCSLPGAALRGIHCSSSIGLKCETLI